MKFKQYKLYAKDEEDSRKAQLYSFGLGYKYTDKFNSIAKKNGQVGCQPYLFFYSNGDIGMSSDPVLFRSKDMEEIYISDFLKLKKSEVTIQEKIRIQKFTPILGFEALSLNWKPDFLTGFSVEENNSFAGYDLGYAYSKIIIFDCSTMSKLIHSKNENLEENIITDLCNVVVYEDEPEIIHNPSREWLNLNLAKGDIVKLKNLKDGNYGKVLWGCSGLKKEVSCVLKYGFQIAGFVVGLVWDYDVIETVYRAEK